MTAQIAERLIYHGDTVAMASEPLGDYFFLAGDRLAFQVNCTALWRGYVGTWEITADRLYLVDLQGDLSDGSQASLASVFPDYPSRVFAHWYSGELRIPEGKLLQYVHAGYGSRYERDRLISISRGVVVAEQVRVNGKSGNPDAPEGYGVAALTRFFRSPFGS